MIINAIDRFRIPRYATTNNKNISFQNSNSEINRDLEKTMGRNLFIPKSQRAYKRCVDIMTPVAKEQTQMAHQLARKYVIYKNPALKIGALTYDHYYLASLIQLEKYAQDIKNGNINYSSDDKFVLPKYVLDRTSKFLWSNAVINQNIKTIRQEIKRKKRRTS